MRHSAVRCVARITNWAIHRRVHVQRYIMDSTRGARAFTSQKQELSVEEMMMKIRTLYGMDQDHGVEHVRGSAPKSQEELPERCMQDSFSTLVIPLASDYLLRKRYATSSGSVRPGRLLELMDGFAVWTTIQYVSLPMLKPGELHPYTFPTVHVDRVNFTDYTPKSDLDVRYCGHVSLAGRSSCEVLMWVEQDVGGNVYRKVAEAVFVMVVRDFVSFAPAFVNKLVLKDGKERQLLAEAEGRKEQRARFARASLLLAAPDSEEQGLLYELFRGLVQPGSPLLTSTLPPGSVWLGDTTHVSFVASHKEEENLHGTVFGGFIMRQGLEVSETCAHIFSKQEPRILQVSDIQFFRGVELGAVLSMHSQVVFTQHNHVQVTTHGEVLDASSGESAVVVMFHCTFQVPEAVASVQPRTYAEAMKYLDGRRHLKRVVNFSSKL